VCCGDDGVVVKSGAAGHFTRTFAAKNAFAAVLVRGGRREGDDGGRTDSRRAPLRTAHTRCRANDTRTRTRARALRFARTAAWSPSLSVGMDRSRTVVLFFCLLMAVKKL
jgi:hypothetical protein